MRLGVEHPVVQIYEIVVAEQQIEVLKETRAQIQQLRPDRLRVLSIYPETVCKFIYFCKLFHYRSLRQIQMNYKVNV